MYKMVIEIEYSEEGIVYHNYNIENPEPLENRTMAWLIDCMRNHFIIDELIDDEDYGYDGYGEGE